MTAKPSETSKLLRTGVAHSPTTGKGRIVVVGLASDVPRALEHPAVIIGHGFDVCGVVTVSGDDDLVRAHADALHQLLNEHKASVVLVAGPLGPVTMRAVSDVAQLNGCRLLAVMPSEVVAGHEPIVVWEGESPLVQLAEVRHASWQYAVKRALDVAGASIALAVLSPLFLLVAIAIRLESKGPAIFQHWRIGKNGRGFHCLKFRTMVDDAEDMLMADPAMLRRYRENNFRIPDHVDARVTRYGRLLRRTSIDELPQLWNVLVGEMSLVGPRPLVADELDHYAGSERLLLSVRPGITGMWAVTGRHHVGYPARSELELRYVREWSLRGDVAIAARTFGAIIEFGAEPDR